jgi:hypothetical protein
VGLSRANYKLINLKSDTYFFNSDLAQEDLINSAGIRQNSNTYSCDKSSNKNAEERKLSSSYSLEKDEAEDYGNNLYSNNFIDSVSKPTDKKIDLKKRKKLFKMYDEGIKICKTIEEEFKEYIWKDYSEGNHLN